MELYQSSKIYLSFILCSDSSIHSENMVIDDVLQKVREHNQIQFSQWTEINKIIQSSGKKHDYHVWGQHIQNVRSK